MLFIFKNKIDLSCFYTKIINPHNPYNPYNPYRDVFRIRYSMLVGPSS